MVFTQHFNKTAASHIGSNNEKQLILIMQSILGMLQTDDVILQVVFRCISEIVRVSSMLWIGTRIAEASGDALKALYALYLLSSAIKKRTLVIKML